MWILEALGVICILLIAFFFPRTIVAILLCTLLGGGLLWLLFVPLTIGGLIIDIA